jgi:hypothetical protein
MHATVLVERIGPKKYRASTTQPVVLESEGKSRREALGRLAELARKRLAAGQLVQITLQVPEEANPWKSFAGIWKDHPDFDAFVNNIKDYRASMNNSDASDGDA